MGSEGIADHVADIMRDESRLLDFQLIENARDVDTLVLLRVAGVRMRRKAHAAQIGDHDGVIPDEHGGERRPHVSGVAEAVQHKDRRAVSSDADI